MTCLNCCNRLRLVSGLQSSLHLSTLYRKSSHSPTYTAFFIVLPCSKPSSDSFFPWRLNPDFLAESPTANLSISLLLFSTSLLLLPHNMLWSFLSRSLHPCFLLQEYCTSSSSASQALMFHAGSSETHLCVKLFLTSPAHEISFYNGQPFYFLTALLM